MGSVVVSAHDGAGQGRAGTPENHAPCHTGVTRTDENSAPQSIPPLLSDDLAAIVAAWPGLPAHVKLAILALAGVKA